MVSFIVFIIGISILALSVFCLSLIASLIQFILNLIVANILPIGLILFGLFTLFVILAIFLPEPEQSKEKTKIQKAEYDSRHSTAQAYTRENIVCDEEKSNKNAIDVKSTVVKEEAKSTKSYPKKKANQVSKKLSTKEKLSSSTEKQYRNKHSFQTQTSVLFERNVATESRCEIEREQIHYSGSPEVKPQLRRLKLSQSKTTIKSGETVQFKAAGLDRFNNRIKISDRISWSATAGQIDSTGLFSFDSIDDVLVTVTAKVSEIEATAKVNIENIYELLTPPKLKSLKVIPDCICLKPKEEQLFTALGFDWDNNLIDCGEIIWSATGGTIDENGKLKVFDDAKGIYQVTATSKHTAKYSTAAKTTLLTLGVSTRILSWAIANEEFFYDILAPLLNLTNNDDSLSETDAIVQGWILEIGRRRIAKLFKEASNLSFKEALSNLSDSIDYIVLPELRKIEFINPPSKVKQGDLVQLKVIGLDQARDRINVDNQIIWTTTSGSIDSQGIFVANSDTNSVEITAKVEGTNIKTKAKIKIKASFEKHYIESAKPEPLNNLSNSIKAVASKTREIVSNNNFRREKVSEDSVNHKKPENKFPSTKNTKPNISTSTNKQEKTTEIALESLNCGSQSDSLNGSSSNTNSSDSNFNSSSNILPLGISNSRPIKHYKNILALERLESTRICNTDRRLISYLDSTEESEFYTNKKFKNKPSYNDCH